MRVLRVVLVGLIAAIACGNHATPVAPPAPTSPRGVVIRRDIAFVHDTLPILRFARPFAYTAIRQAVERCSGLTRDGWPTFYIASVNPLPGFVLAFYTEGSRSVVFALGMEVSPETVSHELLHFLLAPHVNPIRRRDESYEQWVDRTHPDTVFGRGDTPGKCSHILYPGT